MTKSDREVLIAVGGVFIAVAIGFSFGIAYGFLSLGILGMITMLLSCEEQRRKKNEKNTIR